MSAACSLPSPSPPFISGAGQITANEETKAQLIKLKVLRAGLNIVLYNFGAVELGSASQLDPKDRLLVMITPWLEVKQNRSTISFDFTALMQIIVFIFNLFLN